MQIFTDLAHWSFYCEIHASAVNCNPEKSDIHTNTHKYLLCLQVQVQVCFIWFKAIGVRIRRGLFTTVWIHLREIDFLLNIVAQMYNQVLLQISENTKVLFGLKFKTNAPHYLISYM